MRSHDQAAKLLAPDGAENDQLGTSVAIVETSAMIGAPLDDAEGDNAGTVYVLDLSCAPNCVRGPEWICDGGVDADGQVNPVDSGLLQAAFGSADEQELRNYDGDCDGQINPVDSGILQSLFGICGATRGACS